MANSSRFNQYSNISQDSAYHSRYGSSSDSVKQYFLPGPCDGAQVRGRYPGSSWPPLQQQQSFAASYEVENIFEEAAFRNSKPCIETILMPSSHLDDVSCHFQREFGSQNSVLLNKNDVFVGGQDKRVMQPLPQRAKSFSYSQISPLQASQMTSSNYRNRNMNGLSPSNEGFSVKIKPCYNTTTQTDGEMDEMRMKIESREARDNNLISSSSVESKMIQTNMRPLSHSASHGQLQGLKNSQNDDAFRLSQHQSIISIQKRIDSDISTRVSELSESSQSGAVRNMCEDMNQLSQASMIRRLSKELYDVGVMNRLSSRSERQPRLGSIDETTQSHDLSNYNERMNINMRRSSSERDEQNLRRSDTSISDDRFQSSYDHPHQSSLEISESNELSPNAMTTDGSNFVRNRKSQMSLRKAFGIYDEFDAIERNRKSLMFIAQPPAHKPMKEMTDELGLYKEQLHDVKTTRVAYTSSPQQKHCNAKKSEYTIEMNRLNENSYSQKISSDLISSASCKKSQAVDEDDSWRGSQKETSTILTPFEMTSCQGTDSDSVMNHSYGDNPAFRDLRNKFMFAQFDDAATTNRKSDSLPPKSSLSISDESGRPTDRMSLHFQQRTAEDFMIDNKHEMHVPSVGLQQPNSSYHNIQSSTMQSNFPSSSSSPPPSLPPRQYRKGSAGTIFHDSPSVETDSVLFSSNDFDYDSTIKKDIYAQQLRQQAKRLSHSNTSIVSTGRAHRQLVQPFFDENRTPENKDETKILLQENAVIVDDWPRSVAENSSSNAIMRSENVWNDPQVQPIGAIENAQFLHETWTDRLHGHDDRENSEEILLFPTNSINTSMAVDNSEISSKDGALKTFHSSSSCSDGALKTFHSSSSDGALEPIKSSDLLIDKSTNNQRAINISKKMTTEINLSGNDENLNATCDHENDVKCKRNALTNQLKQEEDKEKKSKKKTELSNLLSDNQWTSKQNNTVGDNKEKSLRRHLKTYNDLASADAAADDDDDDDRAAINASMIDRSLSNSLLPSPNHKTAAYYMAGLFDDDDEGEVVQIETLNRYSVQRASLRNRLMDARHNLEKPQPPVMSRASGNSRAIQQSRLEMEKVALVCKLEKNLATLKQERQLLDEEITENNELGRQVTTIVEQRLEAKEFGKYKLYVDELEKVLYLLLKLSDRLAKAENAIICLSQNASDKEKEALISKRNELSEKHSDAKSLKEGIDRRRHQVSGYLEKCLSSEEFKDYEYFVKMKTQLVVEQQEIEDMIELGNKQLNLLKTTLNSLDDLKSSDC